MKNSLLAIFLIFTTLSSFYGQEKISPINNSANSNLLRFETSKMQWFMIRDSLKIPIGIVETAIKRNKDLVYIITSVDMNQTASKWIDSTIVKSKNFEPIYHSSFNQQRDIVLNFNDQKITGYYLDKRTDIKTKLSKIIDTSFFDSNFYPQLIRLLPLQKDYSAKISIFDYNPESKTGVMTATITNTEKSIINLKGKNIDVWKVDVTDDISGNEAISTYFIDVLNRKILKQEITSNGRKMVMEIFEE